MKFLEIIVGFALLVVVLGVGVNFLTGGQVKVGIYLDKLTEDSYRISLYNYSQFLVENTTDTDQGYIYFSGNHFVTGVSGQFYYNCTKNTGDLIDIIESYNGIFCSIDFEGKKIYNYNLN